MYTSLDRIDIVTKAREDGRQGYLLTDHRSPDEIEQEAELSVLFAVTRVLAARRMGEAEGGADVKYVCAAAPPAFLRDAVRAAGASVEITGAGVVAAAAPQAVDVIVDGAFRGLAERVRQRDGAELDEALLVRLEDAVLAQPPDAEDEGTYWQTIHELAAVCGELLRERIGGAWAQSDDGGLLFGFRVGDATFNVADKARRFLDEGPVHRPSFLLRVAEDHLRTKEGGVDDGPLFVNLKPADFGRSRVVWRPILDGVKASDLPVVALGRDQPNTFAYLPAGTPDADALFAEALANVAGLKLAAEEHVIAGVKVYVVSGHYYAAEKILDRTFLSDLQRRLGTPMLAAAVPQKGVLFLTPEVAPPGIATFALIAKTQFENKDGAPPISPAVLLVKDGEVVGHLGRADEGRPESGRKAGTAPGSPVAERAPVARPGFFKRLFRGH